MRWERRKPLWPFVAALGLLLLLVLAAPYSWQNTSPRTVPGRDAQTQRSSQLSAASRQTAEILLIQEPVARPTQIPMTTTRQPSLVPSVAFANNNALPARRVFDLDTLLSVRDQLTMLLDHLPDEETSIDKSITISSTPTVTESNVRVASSNDRLAMAPRRTRPANSLPTHSVPNRTTHSETEDFAGLLLEAALQPKRQHRSRPVMPRLAMVPTLAPPKTVENQTPASSPSQPEPTLASAPPPEPQLTPEPALAPPALGHRPQALIKQLEGFSAGSAGAMWSQQVLTQIRKLTEEQPAAEHAPLETLARLEQLHVLGTTHSRQLSSESYTNRWQQATKALGRRIQLWRVLLDPQQPRIIESSPATVSLVELLDTVSQRLKQAENGRDWREYLLIDRIAELTSEGLETPTLARAKLAQEILSRMSDPQLTADQNLFLSTPEFVQFRQALRPWAAGKVNLETLAALVERYETGREIRYAEVIAQLQQRLKWSDSPQLQALADHLDEHYRGANMRIAMSDLLMNRMLPQQKPIVSPVRDRIANTKVRGRARTTTQLRVRLQPDPQAWHVSLEANGKVYSDTRSDTWPARIRNAARMQYQASKEIEISQQGVETTPARATARGRNELLGVDSQLDPIPIVGHLLRDMARNKHKKARPAANSQAKAKVVRQVKQRMDSSLEEKLDNFEQKFRDKVLAPIEELALLAEPLDMHTTEQRAVMQLRLANTGQLAAHTLRPYAPSDSVLSLQMHETAINNAMMGLGLDGRRMTMIELFEFITKRLGKTDVEPPADMPKKAIIHFAKRDAVRVQCQDDRLELVLSVAELAHRRDKIKNFEIHVHFRPVLNGLSVRLVRDGTLQFSGRRLKTGPRVVLHSILGKVLAEDQEYTLVSPKLMLDPRFAGLMVTQLVLEDGWVGLAIGPAHARRTAWRGPQPEVLPTPFVR